MLQAGSFAQSTMIGTIPSTCLQVTHVHLLFDLIFVCSIHVKLRNAAPGYDFTSTFFLRCLYAGENGNPQNPDKGFLKGPLLLHVSQFVLHTRCMTIDKFQTYWHIFIPHPSASNGNAASETVTRRQVTPRSIAYTATQVSRVLHHTLSHFIMFFLLKLVFSLHTTWEWKLEHASFHYLSFYNFIVDYLEAHDVDGKVNALLIWWNR